MANFVLVDAPNFVLVDQAAQADDDGTPPGEPAYLNPVFGEVLRLLGLRGAAGELLNPLSFDDAAAMRMRRILARYGFELPPLTMAELLGLFEYCDRLDVLTGRGLFADHQLAAWQGLSFALGPSARSPCRQALAFYAVGDLHGLRALHREQGTLVQLGRRYRSEGA